MNAFFVDIPCDVLLDGKQRLGPKLLAMNGGPEYEAIYGFSGKESYDLFCANSELQLTPYPLVKRYLQNQISESGNTARLVVVDAAGPREAHLNAATMKLVLEAQKQKSHQVAISFRLKLDGESQSYRVEKASPSLDATSKPAATQ